MTDEEKEMQGVFQKKRSKQLIFPLKDVFFVKVLTNTNKRYIIINVRRLLDYAQI